MNTDFGFIGHYFDTAENHDKIWGYFYRPTPNPYIWVTKSYGWNCCIFWGRRGKAMQFKADVTGDDLDKLVRTKVRKGYDEISADRLDAIWPTFEEEMKLKLSFEVLAGRVK